MTVADSNRARRIYDPAEWMPRILEALREGATLRQVCRGEGYPSARLVAEWAVSDAWAPHYARAREAGYHAMADEVLDLADDGTNDWVKREGRNGETIVVLNAEAVARSRLRFDARRWLLSKALPKIYGDKSTLEHTGPDNGPVVIKFQSRLPEGGDDA